MISTTAAAVTILAFVLCCYSSKALYKSAILLTLYVRKRMRDRRRKVKANPTPTCDSDDEEVPKMD